MLTSLAAYPHLAQPLYTALVPDISTCHVDLWSYLVVLLHLSSSERWLWSQAEGLFEINSDHKHQRTGPTLHSRGGSTSILSERAPSLSEDRGLLLRGCWCYGALAHCHVITLRNDHGKKLPGHREIPCGHAVAVSRLAF